MKHYEAISENLLLCPSTTRNGFHLKEWLSKE